MALTQNAVALEINCKLLNLLAAPQGFEPR